MKDKTNYSTALSIRSMLDDLNRFRRDRIIDKFKISYSPFGGIKPESSNIVLFINLPDISKENIFLDIISEDKKLRFKFWINSSNIKFDLINIILKSINLLADFVKEKDNIYYKEYVFPEEEEENALNYLTSFFSLINEKKEEIKNVLEAH